MPRQRSSFDRITGVKEPSLLVIATEGEVTEQRYFEGIREKLEEQGSQLKIRVLPPRANGLSAPKHVLDQLDEYVNEYGIQEYDDLCLVIDRDKQSWELEEIAWVAQECSNKQYLLALSNPCFEIWLLLHDLNISTLPPKQLELISENKKHYLKNLVSSTKGGYNLANLHVDDFWPNTDVAIQRARKLDTEPKDRWPNDIATRVYLIIEKIRDVFSAS